MMTEQDDLLPKVNSKRFICPYPHCKTCATQSWRSIGFWLQNIQVPLVLISTCAACGNHAIWYGRALLYPVNSTAPLANQDMPESIKLDYEEAAEVFELSPRSACALLRLCIQKICVELGLPGRDLNADIGRLVQNGLPPQMREALDLVRIIGNEAVHPGQLDINDDRGRALFMFDVVNRIVEHQISFPKRLHEEHERLPIEKLKAIEARDKK